MQNMNEQCDNHQSCRVSYQWNASQYLARNWVLCHKWCPYWDLLSTHEILWGPVFENVLISPIHFTVDDICFVLLPFNARYPVHNLSEPYIS
jgi:hypothetical protein